VCVLSNGGIAHDLEWPGGVVVRALDLRVKRSSIRISAVPLPGNNPGQVVHTRAAVGSFRPGELELISYTLAEII